MKVITNGVKNNSRLSEENDCGERYPKNWMDSRQKISDFFDFHFSAEKQSILSKLPPQKNLDETSKMTFFRYDGFQATDSGRVAVLEVLTQ